MNKAFVREPEPDGRVYCPRCGTLGVPVGAEPLATHVLPASRTKLRDAAWYCSLARCEVAYFNELEAVVLVDELNGPVYPKDLDAPPCPCFGFTYDEVEADVREGEPSRIRQLLAKSRSSEACCATLGVDGRCCMSAVQELDMKLRSRGEANDHE